MKSIKRRYLRCYLKIRRTLTKKPCLYFVLFLSHGGTHLLLLIFLTCVGLYLFSAATQEEGPEYHEVHVDLRQYYNRKINKFNISALINSDSIFKNTGYHQCLYIETHPLISDSCQNGIKIEEEKYRYKNELKISRYPYNSKWEIRDDSAKAIKEKYRKDKYGWYVYELNESNDSLFKLNLYQKKYGYNRVTVYGDEMFTPSSQKKNPYYYFHLRLDENMPDSMVIGQISIAIGDISYNDKIMRFSTTPLKIDYVYPEPDLINFSYVYYKSTEKIQKVRENKGVIVQAEDIELMNYKNRMAFIYSILLGAVVAFWLDVLIHLIVKWRNLNLKYKMRDRINRIY